MRQAVVLNICRTPTRIEVQDSPMPPTPPAVIIVFDGCRPDGLAQAATPHVDSLWQRGAYTWAAQSVVPSYTLPTHTTMFRSVPPDRHGVLSNTFNPAACAYPSILDVAHAAGLHTAMFYSWGELRDLASPGSLEFSYLRAPRPDEDIDAHLASVAADYLVRERPDLTFLYLQQSDIAGHDAGWMSRPYLDAIEAMDRALGLLLARLESAGLREQITFLLLADHGGQGRTHDGSAPEDTLIPWIISGPAIRRGHALRQAVHLADTAATLAHALGLSAPATWEGRPVREAFYD